MVNTIDGQNGDYENMTIVGGNDGNNHAMVPICWVSTGMDLLGGGGVYTPLSFG